MKGNYRTWQPHATSDSDHDHEAEEDSYNRLIGRKEIIWLLLQMMS